MYISRFMEQNKHHHNSVKMMKLTFFAFCIFAIQINENLADILVDCVQGKTCNKAEYWGECGQGICLNRPDDPKETCYCPYENFSDTPVVCKQGKTCYGGDELGRHDDHEISGYGVSRPGIQNKKGFCIKINLPKGNY